MKINRNCCLNIDLLKIYLWKIAFVDFDQKKPIWYPNCKCHGTTLSNSCVQACKILKKNLNIPLCLLTLQIEVFQQKITNKVVYKIGPGATSWLLQNDWKFFKSNQVNIIK